jgi:fucose 4-O-acetylase-like acetyltransferase
MSTDKRDVWIDNIKVIACLLVFLGHFIQSIIKANIVNDSGALLWFVETIYFFHVPLFFLCSGYLFQKYSSVINFTSWKSNFFKKSIVLGVPYFAFSVGNWVLQFIFSGAINGEAGNIFDVLFVHPGSPFWFLYILYFIFVITPTYKTNKIAIIGLLIALALKMCSIFFFKSHLNQIYLIKQVTAFEVWFVIGQCLNFYNLTLISKKYIIQARVVVVVFTLASILMYHFNIVFPGKDFLMGLIACTALIIIFYNFSLNPHNFLDRGFKYLSAYTMSIFLMHVISASCFRILLLKLGIMNPLIHVLVGVSMGIFAPIIITEIILKAKGVDFILYPAKYIAFNK